MTLDPGDSLACELLVRIAQFLHQSEVFAVMGARRR
jgi:hypothetical protein